MLHTKSRNTCFVAGKQTIGEKIVSVLNRPLFTIPLPVPKHKKDTDRNTKPVMQGNVKQRKPVKRRKPYQMPVMVPQKPVMPRKPKRHEGITNIFTPNLNKEEYEKIMFVLNACNLNNGKEFTNVIHIEQTKTGSLLVSTDGKRMHVAKIGTKIKSGNYKPIVRQDSIILGKPISDVRFPDWEKVVPHNVLRCGCINLENTTSGNIKRVNSTFTRMSGEKVNPDYLSDLTKKPWVIYRQDQNRRPLLLKEEGAKKETYAVIMPLAA